MMTLINIIFLIYILRKDITNEINKEKFEIVKNDATFIEPDDQSKKSEDSSIEMTDFSNNENIKKDNNNHINNISLVVKENIDQ